jgi:hypothetical protein
MKNYCGFEKAKLTRPPYWALFNASCKIHDDNYTDGGAKEDRLKADLGFFWRMLEDINKLEDYKSKKRATRYAIIYYICVRCFGRFSFNKINK